MSHKHAPNSFAWVPHFSRVLCAKSGDCLRNTWSTPIFAALGLILFSLAAFAQKPAASSTETLPAGPMQAKATTACTECHEARIIVQQRLSKAAWAKEVDKMIKWGALVDASDHDAFVDYLSAHFGVDQPPYEPPRSAMEAPSTVKSK